MKFWDCSDEINTRGARMGDDIYKLTKEKKMDSIGITPVMPIDGGIGGGNSFIWIFGLLILLGLFNGNGFGFGGNNNANALGADMQRGFDAQNLQAQTRDILGAVTNGTAQTIAASTANAANAIEAIKDGNASLIREFGNVETALVGIGGQMQNCCCEVKQQIMQNNYDASMRDAATNANITNQIQGIKDLLYQNKVEALQAQISALQLQSATSNVLRFPNSWAFTGGVFPPVQTAAAA